MDANRLEALKQRYTVEKWDADLDDMLDALQHIDQQQDEIERLNRAYEVLEKRMRVIAVSASSPVTQYHATASLEEAQRIKEGKDGEQGWS